MKWVSYECTIQLETLIIFIYYSQIVKWSDFHIRFTLALKTLNTITGKLL